MRRETGFGSDAAALILARSYGMCEIMLPGCTNTMDTIHHRRPRGMGGTRRVETNEAANGLSVCRYCHNYVESHRTYALQHGFLVAQGETPADVPVWWRRGRWGRNGQRRMVLLNNTGEIQQLSEENS